MAVLARTSPAILAHSRVSTPSVVIARRHGRAQPHGLNHVQHKQSRNLTRVHAKRATESDEREIEEMKRAAEKGDMLEGGAADALVKVLAISAAVGLVVLLSFLGLPVIQNTVASFPSAS